jgi:hypothetical protein
MGGKVKPARTATLKHMAESGVFMGKILPPPPLGRQGKNQPIHSPSGAGAPAGSPPQNKTGASIAKWRRRPRRLPSPKENRRVHRRTRRSLFNAGFLYSLGKPLVVGGGWFFAGDSTTLPLSFTR